ncbi:MULTISPECIES: GAF domain-containing protein [Dyella]|uniref:GAF domain-containing protein n=2 Tax=Dyella TaxID=231454 RepID=A0A4R0YR95_9GAMM|nr:MULTISPECIES: GAF domain-containing protein [Dyella]TBR35807.1 GAF domain-containing protein [Dyella terrae]TCI08645.1 GAF domain-containing protein [Dyella soli]
MPTQESSSDYAWPPSVVGFDMPSSTTHPDVPPVMIALLDTQPDHFWIEAFACEVETFRKRHELEQVRLDVRSLVVAGPIAKLRGLTTTVRDFVHRVSRISLQRRVMERLRSGSSSTPEEENQAATRDVDLVAHIPVIGKILEAVSRETGMRFATVARVSDTRWTACAVYDTINFGLRAGQDLVLETTICNEIREHGHIVTIDHASAHPHYSRHPTPALYGFESYISIPIYRADGRFFGTLCAVDPLPRRLDPATIRSLEKYAKAIGAEIDARSEER